MAKTHADRFSEGVESEWHADLEHLRDISACLRSALFAKLNDDLQSFRTWWNSLDALHCMLLSYAGKKEQEVINAARAPPVPDPRSVQKLRLDVNLHNMRTTLNLWETALRLLIVRKGFAIRASEGDTDDWDIEAFKKGAGLS